VQTDITFTPQSGLIRYLRDRASILDLSEETYLPLDVVSDRSKLGVLGAPSLWGCTDRTRSTVCW